MKGFSKKTAFIPFFFAGLFVFVGLTTCNRGEGAVETVPELTLMMWSGDDKYYADIGAQNLRPEELASINMAAAYATAKAYKAVNPNVKINIYAKSGADNDEDGSWEQHRENFRMEYGVYPDIYAANDVIGDLQRGLIADLSIFADDPMYKSFNPQIMALMNVEGRQFGIPQYLLPWGIYVNKSLADANNIDIPDPDWNIAEFTRFISHSRQDIYYGIMGDFAYELAVINTGSRDYSYMLLNHQPGQPFVNINSDATRNLLRYFQQWRMNSLYGNRDLGLVSDEFMDEHWWWGFKFFIEGKLLTLPADPWMMGDAAHPDVANHWGAARVEDWDIYPRPGTDYMDPTIGVVLDPFVIRNYAMDDGNPELNAEEEAKLRLAWDFMKFWCGDTRSWQARASQMWMDGDSMKSALNDSFPMVTGPEFNRQMEIWYQPDNHQRFRDRNKMPGFQYVLELWEKGQFWVISEKSYPWYYDFEGTRRDIVYEWENAWNEEIAGALSTDPNWLDQVYARLPGWNTAINQRFENEMRRVEDALNRYYPKR